jgi:hypothetical protein
MLTFLCFLQGLYNHEDPASVLRDVVFLPIEALVNTIIGNAEGDGKLPNQYAIKFRLRCVLMMQLFQVFETIGIRAEVPNFYVMYPLYHWMTKDFLKLKGLKHQSLGLKYSASNIPVIIGLINYFIGTGDILIPLNLRTLFSTEGTQIKPPKPTRDYRDSIDLKFVFKGMPKMGLTFKRIIMILIYGCDPFIHEPSTPDFKKPVEGMMSIFEKTTRIDFRKMMSPILHGGLQKEKVKDDKEVALTGFMPDSDHKALKDKFLVSDQTAENKEAAIVQYLKNQEMKYLALAANIRFHIKFMEDSVPDENPFAGEDTKAEDQDSKLLESMDFCRFLKTQAVKNTPKKTKRETKIIGDTGSGEEETTEEAIDLFPEYFRQVARKLLKANEHLASNVSSDGTTYESQWNHVMKETLMGKEVVMSVVPPVVSASVPGTELNIQSQSESTDQHNQLPNVPRKNPGRPASVGLVEGDQIEKPMDVEKEGDGQNSPDTENNHGLPTRSKSHSSPDQKKQRLNPSSGK